MPEKDEQKARQLYQDKTLEEVEEIKDSWNEVKQDKDYSYDTLVLALDMHIDSVITEKIKEIQEVLKPHYGVRTIYDNEYYLTVTNPELKGTLSNFPVMKQVALHNVYQPIQMKNGMMVDENYDEVNAENSIRELNKQVNQFLSSPTIEFEDNMEEFIEAAFEMSQEVEKQEESISTGENK